MKKAMPMALVLAVAAPGLAHAQQESQDGAGASPWSGEVNFGYVSTRGNSNTQSMNGAAEGRYTQGPWKHLLRVTALTAEQDEETSAERYQLFGESRYRWSEKEYAFGLGHYDNDRFDGYDYRLSLAGGYGRVLVETPTLLVTAQAGPGVRYSELEEDGGDSDAEFIVHLSGDAEWNFSPSAKLTESLSVEAGEETTITTSTTALTSKLIGALAMKAAFEYRYVSEVPDDKRNTDMKTTLSLVYAF